MRVLKIYLRRPDLWIIHEAVNALRRGGIVAHPTDTCYGFAVDVLNEKAVKKLYRIKKMSIDKPVSIMVENIEKAREYAKFTFPAEKLAEKYWPGALTLVQERSPDLPLFFNSGHKTIGIRVPDCKVSLMLLKEFGGPLSTTSANVTTKKSPYSVDEVVHQFKKEKIRPDLILDGGELPYRPASTIVDVSSGEVKVLREGMVKFT